MLKKYILPFVLGLIMTISLMPSSFAIDNTPKFHCPAPQTCLNFVAINDIYEWKPYPLDKAGSLSRLSTYLKRLHERFPQADVLFAGDLLSPSSDSQLTHGLHMVQGLNTLGIKVASLGNHEFDFGEKGLEEALKTSQFPWISANVEVLPNNLIMWRAILLLKIRLKPPRRFYLYG